MIEIEIESREYRDDYGNQSDSRDDPENNTGGAICAHNDTCPVKLGTDPSNEIFSIQHATCNEQRASCSSYCFLRTHV